MSIQPQLVLPSQQRLICCLPGSRGRVVQSEFGWETVANCAAQSLSPPSLHSQETERLPIPSWLRAEDRADKLPRAEGIAALQYHALTLSLVLLFLPQMVPENLRERLVFFTPTLLAVPQLWRDPSREITGCTSLSGGLVLAPRAWSKIRNLSHYFHITLAWLQDSSHPQSLSWET